MGTGDPPAVSETVHWRAVVRATCVLVGAWLLAAVVLPWWAARLQGTVGGFPLGYWLAAQGALLAFLSIVVACVVWMERLDDAAAPPAADAEDGGR